MFEPWDSVPIKAGELKPRHWGTPEEVSVMAAPVRKARDRRQATFIR